MNKNWDSQPFEECIEPVVYTTKVQRKDFLSDGAYPIVSQEEAFINGFWNQEADIFRVERPLVVFGDHTRALKYIDFDFVLGADGVKVLKPKSFLHPRFFYYQLHTAKLDSLGYARHYRLLKEHQVAYPAYAEQRRIVAILDEAFEVIATAKSNAEKNLRNAHELFALHRDLVFSDGQNVWPVQPLGVVAEVQSGGTPRVSTKDFWGGSIAWYSSGELNDVETKAPNRFLTEAGLAGSNAKLFPKGSLLVGMYDTAALKMSILDRTAAFNQAIAGVKPNARLETEFVFHAINFQKPGLLSLRRGVRQKNLSLAKIKEIVVPVPTVQVQRSVVERLRSAQVLSVRLATVHQRKLRAFEELKAALLAHAFVGSLTSRALDRQVSDLV